MVKEDKRKYLEFIQNVITRMSTISFILKGWAITIVSICFVFAVKDANFNFLILSSFPVLVFWGLDGFYLRQERLFRKLYDSVRVLNENSSEINFSMNTSCFIKKVDSWFMTCLSQTILPMYFMIFMLIIIILLSKNYNLI